MLKKLYLTQIPRKAELELLKTELAVTIVVNIFDPFVHLETRHC